MSHSYHKVTISFPPRDDDLWEYLQSIKQQQNLSDYIRQLIRNDLQGGRSLNQEAIVNEILKAIQQQSEYEVGSDIDKTMIEDETKNTIDNLF